MKTTLQNEKELEKKVSIQLAELKKNKNFTPFLKWKPKNDNKKADNPAESDKNI
jgi:hypothetical protein